MTGTAIRITEAPNSVLIRRRRKGKKRFRRVKPPFTLQPEDELQVSIYNPADSEQTVTVGLQGFIVQQQKQHQKSHKASCGLEE